MNIVENKELINYAFGFAFLVFILVGTYWMQQFSENEEIESNEQKEIEEALKNYPTKSTSCTEHIPKEKD